MKLVRYGKQGLERAGLIDSQGTIRDLSGFIPDVTPAHLGAASLQQLAQLSAEELPPVPSAVRLGACVANVGKFVCVGLNYLDHVRESGATVPSEPILFTKATSCITGPSDGIVIPVGASMVDWEVELGVIIGARAKNVLPQDALDYVAGYCVVNDVSERGWQLQGTGQWVKGKSADTLAQSGPGW